MLGMQLLRAGPALLQSTPVRAVQHPSPFVMHLNKNTLYLYENKHIFKRESG